MELYKNYVIYSLPLVGAFVLITIGNASIDAYVQNIVTHNAVEVRPLLQFILWLFIFYGSQFILFRESLYKTYWQYLTELKKIWDDLETEERAAQPV